MKVKDMPSAVAGMNKLLSFIENIPYENVTYELPWSDETRTEWLPKFIKDVKWSCNTAHIIEKWKISNTTYFGQSNRAFIWFYFGLDSNNSRSLLEYICNNYNDEREI